LRNTALFGGLRDDVLAFVLARADDVQVAAGDWFFREGEPGDTVYLLEQGSAAIVKDVAGSERVLRVLGPGDCFGEMSLIDFSPRSASARATTACSALAVSAACLHALYERDVEQFAMLEMNMGREVSRRLREVDAARIEQGAGR
jgi:CRP-like cAMP-binding protein